ncbi:MAG: type I restriction endonuclease [Hyphomicrobiaceae bacterium]
MAAERTVIAMHVCKNEESTKLYLVIPLLGALGYDFGDPHEVQPEYAADFREDQSNRVDFAILRDGQPIIAVECKKVGTPLEANRGQLRAYFSALQTVKLGILTNGVRFEFFVDSDDANVMDEEPFLTLDMERIAAGGLPSEILDTLLPLTNQCFEPDAIADLAEARLVGKRLRAALVEEVRSPSEEFCRLMLQRVGLKNLRRSSIRDRYHSTIRQAYEEAIVRPVVERLQMTARTPSETIDPSSEVAQRGLTTDRELAVFRYVCRRLAYLVSEEHQFSAIEQVQYRDYIGKFAIFYQNVRKGRLFDFIEGGNGYDKFIFPEPIGEIITNNIIDIDEPLRKTFCQRIRELGAAQRAIGVPTAALAS